MPLNTAQNAVAAMVMQNLLNMAHLPYEIYCIIYCMVNYANFVPNAKLSFPFKLLSYLPLLALRGFCKENRHKTNNRSRPTTIIVLLQILKEISKHSGIVKNPDGSLFRRPCGSHRPPLAQQFPLHHLQIENRNM